jgi:hypothetical protein
LRPTLSRDVGVQLLIDRTINLQRIEQQRHEFFVPANGWKSCEQLADKAAE